MAVDTEAVARTIDPNAVFTRQEFQTLFGLKPSSLRREVRERRLRVAKRCGKYFLLGAWILQWIEAGEVTRKTDDAEGV